MNFEERKEKRMGILAGIIKDYVIAPIRPHFSHMVHFNSNIAELDTQFKKLEETRRGVQMGAEETRRNVRVVGPNVEAWLTRADEATTEVGGIIQDKDKVKEGWLNGWCPNLKLRYSLSKKAMEKTTIIVDLWKEGENYTQSSYPPPPASLETIPSRDFTGFESRRLIMEKIIKALKHDEINLIGVCGMGGVGKTTTVNEVAKKAKEDHHFDEVAMAVVSQEPNLTNVQACIADMLGLKELRDRDSPIVRADLLRKRLLQDNKKILVILDDVWENFDLQALGIPLEGANKNLKMVYTSRTRDLWHDVRTKKEIPLELLSEDEAWQLFKEKVGDSADARNLQPIAKKIANECGRLPLALVIIGSTLSRKSQGNRVEELWEDMLEQLTCPNGTPADERLSKSLELSYKYVEDDKARNLFLLCCLFEEDKKISIEDLVKYGWGLSFFDGTRELTRVRNRVFSLVDDLKSRYLLLDGEKKNWRKSQDEFVKVHDVVRDMGISIASKDKGALVIHGAVSEWPKKESCDDYSWISVVSEKITELREGLTCQNLEFFLLKCSKLEGLPPNFFYGMEKLKVLALNKFCGILTLQSLRNLQTLSLEGLDRGHLLNNISGLGSLLNLEILSFRDSYIGVLPEEIGELVNLRFLDLSGNDGNFLERIPPGVISRLVRLEELYVTRNFRDWEGEGKEQVGRNANLREFESLTKLNTLEITIRSDVLLPKSPIFSRLKKFGVLIIDSSHDPLYYPCSEYKKALKVLYSGASCPIIPLDRGGIDSLIRAADSVYFNGGGCDGLGGFLFRDGVDGLQQLEYLYIKYCDTPEFLANMVQQQPNAPSPSLPVFPILEYLSLTRLPNLREICRGPVPAGSFGKLHTINVDYCRTFRYLFQLPIVLPHLEVLWIYSCDMMEEVICKEEREDVHVATNRIEFPNLKELTLEELPSIVGFCRGIDEIDFPQLKYLRLQQLGLFNSNPSSNSEQNDKFGFLSIFPQKVTFPLLAELELQGLQNVSNIWGSKLPIVLPHLRHLSIELCDMMEEVICKEDREDVHVATNRIEFPNLNSLELWELPSLVSFCKGIDEINFPQLRNLRLERLPSLVSFCKGIDEINFPQLIELRLDSVGLVNGNPSSNSEQNDKFGFLSIFPQKVTFPLLEELELRGLQNVSNIWGSELPAFTFTKLTKLRVEYCGSLRELFNPSMARVLVNLRSLYIRSCSTMEAVVGSEEEVKEGQGIKQDKTLFPQLSILRLFRLPNLRRFCPFTHPIELPLLSDFGRSKCPRMDVFSLGQVSAPCFSVADVSWNGNLNDAIQLMPEAEEDNDDYCNKADEEEEEDDDYDNEADEEEEEDNNYDNGDEEEQEEHEHEHEEDYEEVNCTFHSSLQPLIPANPPTRHFEKGIVIREQMQIPQQTTSHSDSGAEERGKQKIAKKEIPAVTEMLVKRNPLQPGPLHIKGDGGEEKSPAAWPPTPPKRPLAEGEGASTHEDKRRRTG